MYYFTRLPHIVDGFILPTSMRVWVACTHTRTRLPDGYTMLPIYVPAGRNIIPYTYPYRVKPVGYSGFGYPLPSLNRRRRAGGSTGAAWVNDSKDAWRGRKTVDSIHATISTLILFPEANLVGPAVHAVGTWGQARKKFRFWQKPPNCDFFYFIVLPPYLLPKTYEEWVRHKG
jgi:hypothetical protein